MNLVQINERLKDLPMQVLQQYANGMNPEVPPYLALGELQRREIAQKQMATAQGAQQGPQPSVKEQVEQKAGLMALQQMQQQQAMQQMQQPRGPMPAPAGVPQPEDQPEATMMARGGLAAVPVRRDMFEYAGGGIIAFSNGGQPKVEAILRKPPQARTAEENEILERSGIKLQRQQIPRDSAVRRAEESLSQVGPEIREYFTEGASRLSEEELEKAPAVGGAQNERILRALGFGKSAPPPAPAPSRPASVSEAQATAMAGPQAQVPAGLPAALQKAASATPAAAAAPVAGAAPRPAPTGAPAGLPAAAAATAPAQTGAPQGVSPFMAEAAAAAREKPVAPTPEGIIAEQAKLLPPAMQEAAVQKMIAEQRARADARAAAYEKSKPSGLDDLIRVFGQAGQYKGLSGMGPAYTANIDRKRAEDLAFQKQQDELLTAIEGRQYAADKELFGARQGALTAAQKSFQDRLTSNTRALAELAGVDQRRIDEAAQNLNRMQIAKLQAATANRPSEAERIEAKYMGMLAKGQTKEAEEYLNTISKIKGGGAAGVGAARNAIQEKRVQLASWKDIRDNAASETEREEAQRNILQITRDIGKMDSGEGGGGNAFTVTAGGKTYTFPTQEAANKFKAEAGVK